MCRLGHDPMVSGEIFKSVGQQSLFDWMKQKSLPLFEQVLFFVVNLGWLALFGVAMLSYSLYRLNLQK